MTDDSEQLEFINPFKLFVGAFIPNWLLKRPEVSPGAKLCYARLCQFSGEHGEAFPKQKLLSEELGLSTRSRQLRTYLKQLEDFKLIFSIKTDFQKSNTYKFLYHPWMGNIPIRQNTATLGDNPAENCHIGRQSGRKTPIHVKENCSSIRQNAATLGDNPAGNCHIGQSGTKKPVNPAENCLSIRQETASTNYEENQLRESFKTHIREVLEYFNQKTGRKFKLTKEREAVIKKRLEEGRPVSDFFIAIDNFIQDDWEDRPRFTDIQYVFGVMRRIDNFDKWLGFKPKNVNADQKQRFQTVHKLKDQDYSNVPEHLKIK